ncbi:MAG TPA: hypothetical protein VJS38_02510 [Phenylobacterium sp.]|uniref:hypothetical protein n=1 Tax=Phenylobacterium sp. TaxID=1871053 RepID=UPI002B46CF4D|nr:hypothetical protein [Phenylobacterium sp.]HKR87021.1 hypothetical protein [Phenylobacterium sp.]
MPVKSTPAPASAAAARDVASAAEAPRARYRVLPKGAGLVHTGEWDPVTGASLTHDKGAVVEGADPAVAAELEDRGLVEVLDPA